MVASPDGDKWDPSLAPQDTIQTSQRVPQDPSAQRAAMARAVAQAYKRTNAPAARWEALLAALSGDAKARSAAESLRP